jgi:thiol-disulfide isomerase/thioredoxin
MKRNNSIPFVLAVSAALLTGWCAGGTDGSATAAQNQDDDKQACTKQLEKIYKAIQAYRRDHKDLPNWLSDLAPNYIADKDQLICPITRRTGRTHAFEQLKDPKMPRAYLYEFSPLSMGDVWQGGKVRMRDFKRRQMGLYGGDVPIVRCQLHDSVLNLAFSGRIYDSGINWEENFADYVDFQASAIPNLFPELLRPTAAQQPRLEDESGPEQLVGAAAPEFTLPMLEGGTFELASHQGKRVVLLDFWATWCGPCRAVMPTLVEVSRDYADKGVRYFAVNLREQPETIRKYLKDAQLDIAVPLDKDGDVAKKYGVRGIPTMVIVGKDGKVKKVHVGSSPGLKAELTRTLDGLLADSTLGAANK